MKINRAGNLFMLVGTFLIGAALALLVFNNRIDLQAGEDAGQLLAQVEALTPQRAVAHASSGLTATATPRPQTQSPMATPLSPTTPAPISQGALDAAVSMPAVKVNQREYIGTVEIPSLRVKLPVLSRWDSDAAQIAPCRFEGSIYDGSLIVAGHNFKSHFGRLSSLSEGDTVLFTDMNGTVFTYKVKATEIIDKYDVEQMEAGDWDLTLFTCTVGGAQRVTVRCQVQ